MRPETATRLDPSRTALLVVDVQNDFCHADGAFGVAGHSLDEIQAMVPRLNTLIEQCRARGVDVIFIRTEHGPWTDSAAWLGRHEGSPGHRGTTCLVGSWGAELYEVEPTPADAIVVKHRYSGFIGTDLEIILRARGAESLLLTGVATNVCVESTLRDGFMLGFRTILVEDCAATTSQEAQAATVWNVKRHFGDVATSQEILEALAPPRQAEAPAPIPQVPLTWGIADG